MDGADNELRYIFVYDELLYRYRSSAACFIAGLVDGSSIR